MRTALLLLPLLFLLSLGSGAVRAEDLDDEPIHPDDVALTKRVGLLLPPKGPIVAFEKALGSRPYETRDLGFGATWRRYELFGETVTLRIDIVTHADRIAGVRVHSPDGSKTWKQSVRETWGDRVVIQEDGIEWRHDEKPVRAAWDRALAEALGRPTSKAVGEAFKASVALLTDPLAELAFGDSCYEDGSAPPGREAASGLLLEGAMNALDHVLRGPNPEGRVYAADAFLLVQAEGEDLGVDRRAAIKRVVQLGVPIRNCGGCLFSDDPAATLLTEALVRDRIACRILEWLHTGIEWKDVGEIRVYWDGTYARRLEDVRQRGILPESVRGPLLAAVQKGEGFLVELGTPIYVRHLDDGKTKPPAAIQALLDHLD